MNAGRYNAVCRICAGHHFDHGIVVTIGVLRLSASVLFKRMKITRILLFIIILTETVCSQSFRARRLTTDDGLSQSFVFCILKDSRGFMWFGTKDGLNKYDGYKFTVYRNDPRDVNSLPSNYISALFEDKSGILWIGTALGGVCSFDRTTETFHRYQHNPSDSNSLTSNRVSSIFEDSRGYLWIGTQRGLNLMDPQRKRIEHFFHDAKDTSSIIDDDIHSITENKSGNVWIVTAGGVDVFDHSSGRFIHFLHIAGSPSTLASNDTYAILSASDGSLWLGTSRSLDRYANGKFTHYIIHDDKTSHYNVTQIVEDPQGKLWLISNFALVRFDPRTSHYEFIRAEPATSAMYIDNTGTLWLGANGKGVDRFPSKGNRFELYEGQRIENVMFGDLISKLDKFAGKKFVYPSIHGQSFAEDKDGNVWIATLFDGIFFYNIREKRFLRYQYRPDMRHLDDRRKVYFPYVGLSGRIWIGTEYGVAELDRRTKKFVYYRLYRDDYKISRFERLSGSYNITCMNEDSSGILWVGTPDAGLIRFDPSDGSKLYYTFKARDTTSLSSNFILSIEPDPLEPSRYLWIGTDGGGMNKFDKKAGQAEHFDDRNGLPNNVVYGILADRAGYLWLSTNRGLCRFDPRTRIVRVFDVRDGLQSNEFNRREFFRTRDGKMYFGGIGGVDAFYPEQVKDNPHIPPIVITDFKILNRSVTPGRPKGILIRPITMTDTIAVDYRDNVLSFEFASLDYSEPEKNEYEYMLEGFDSRWIMAGSTDRSVTYTNLDPGKYILRVKGSNNDGVWNETGRSLVLIVNPPFWMTVWFRVSAGLILFLVVAGTARYVELRKIRERTRRLEQETAIERERLRISKDMHDDIGSRLTEISLLSNLASRTPQNPAGVKKNLDDISSTANEIVTALDEIVWAVNPKYDTVEDVMDYLAQFGATYLERANIECHVDLPAVETGIPVPTETRHNIFMVMKESLNNIVKYADTKEAWIQFELLPHQLSMTVRDSGKGFDTDEVKKFSEGLNNMKRRMEEVGGTCEITSQHGVGTIVRAVIPLKDV